MLRTARPDAEVTDHENPRPGIVGTFCRRKPAIASLPSPRLSPQVGAGDLLSFAVEKTPPEAFRMRVATARTASPPLVLGSSVVIGRRNRDIAIRRPALALIGPFRGGRVLAVTGVPGEPQHFYFGSVNGGVWETHDAGRTWQPIFDGQPVGSIGAIAVAPSNPRVIYVGTGEADMRSDIAQGDGMYKSTDGGKTWTHIGLADSQQIGAHPGRSARIRTWSSSRRSAIRTVRTPSAASSARATAARTGRRCSAQGRRHRRDRPRLRAGQSERHLRRAVADAAHAVERLSAVERPGQRPLQVHRRRRHWTRARGNGFPAKRRAHRHRHRASAAAARLRDRRRATAGGLYRSDDARRALDAGRAATRASGSAAGTSAASRSSRKNADRVYALNTIVLRSDDGGETFRPLKGDAERRRLPRALDRSRAIPERQILGVDQGAVVSLNGGRTWS